MAAALPDLPAGCLQILGRRRGLLGAGGGPQRERGSEYVVVLISEYFAGVPWLERVYQAASLWDAAEMGGAADVHCYTPGEFERRRASLPDRTIKEGST